MASIVQLRQALPYAWCELLCPRLRTGRCREIKRLAEWSGLPLRVPLSTLGSVSKLLYIYGLEDMDWGVAVSGLYLTLRERKRGAWSCSLPLPFQGMCVLPKRLSNFSQAVIVNSIPSIGEYLRYPSVTAFWYANVTGRRGQQCLLGWTEYYRCVLFPEPNFAHKELVHIHRALLRAMLWYSPGNAKHFFSKKT